MKTRLIFLVLLITCYSCGTNKSVSDAEKEKMRGEVKEIAHAIFKGAEEANFDKVIETWYDSPDFVYMCNGKTYNYKECMDEMKQFLNVLINQKCTIVDEKYAVIDNSTVLGTINTTWLMNFKDGHSVLQDPWAVQFTFRKIDNRWRVIYHVESGVEKTVKYKEPSKELNQIELFKQFIGNFKSESTKDTVSFVDVKNLRGGALELYYKLFAKGKLLIEEKWLWGYDKTRDKYIVAITFIGSPNILLEAWWFTTKTTCEVIPYNYIDNPEQATSKQVFEFKSPDLAILTYMKDNKPLRSYPFSRIK